MDAYSESVMESPEVRRRTMQAVKSKNTTPELIVRRLLHASGYRYRLHNEDLPGRPDLVFPVRQKVIFIHGCFWHGHDCKRGARVPKTNRGYWVKKVSSNQSRDLNARKRLKAGGWKVLCVWECELRNTDNVLKRLTKFLD
jgi:DNA mismatch endonuclease (patch repair protein)